MGLTVSGGSGVADAIMVVLLVCTSVLLNIQHGTFVLMNSKCLPWKAISNHWCWT